MTVAELIEELKKYPSDTIVVLYDESYISTVTYYPCMCEVEIR
jgi:thymidylate synthase